LHLIANLSVKKQRELSCGRLLKKDGRTEGEEAQRQAQREREEKGGNKLRSRESAGERVGQEWKGKRAQAREKEGGAKESAQGSSERERQLAAFSRDDAASRPRLGFPRGGGKTRLVSLSLITILCVVVDDEGRRRASGPVYRQ